MSNVRVTRPYRKRRQYTPEFKAQLVAESQNPEASVARIALDNDLNANLLRRWITESKQAGQLYMVERETKDLPPDKRTPSGMQKLGRLPMRCINGC